MPDSGEHKIEVLTLLKGLEKKVDMVIELMTAFRERLAKAEARLDINTLEQIKGEAEE